MAFTSKSERVLDFGIPKHVLTPAPTLLMRELAQQKQDEMVPLSSLDLKRRLSLLKDYQPVHQEYKAKPAKVPFNCSTARKVGGGDEEAGRKYNPGPGIYEYDVGFDAINKKK